MTASAFRYRFQEIPVDEVEDTLLLAILATEALRGESQVRLDARHYFDTKRRACVIDARTRVGRDLNRLFVGLLRHEFGTDAFQVDRVEPPRETACASNRNGATARKARA
jgi:hypothetical protein